MAFQKGKVFLLILLLEGTSVIQTGCGFKDIDKRIFVMAIGVDQSDKEKEHYKVTLKLAVPSGSLKDATGKQYSYLTYESENLADAIRKLKTHVDKEFDFGHMKVILIGEKLLEKDLSQVIDLFVRRRDFQMISRVGIGKPNAEKVLKTEPASEMAASTALFNFFDGDGVESPYIVTTFLFDLRRRMLEEGIDPVLPVLSTDKKSTKIIVNHSMILNDKKKALELNPHQTKIYNILENRVQKLDLLFKKEDVEFTISIDTVNTDYKILTQDRKRPVLKMNVKMAGIIEEADHYVRAKELKAYSKRVSKEVENWVEDVLLLWQEKKLDPIGFGLHYKATHLSNQDRLSQWEEEIFPNLEFDVTAVVNIKSTGIIE